MNRNQWFVLAWGFMILGIFFISIDTLTTSCLGVSDDMVSVYEVYCVVNAEMYEPFIYLTYFLFIVFMICGFLEPKKK